MYHRTPPTVYAVHWPDIGVLKVGYSDCQRYRIFMLRGARLVELMEFATVTEALRFETACHEVLRTACRPAFLSAASGAPHLGSNGGGYLECFKVPGDLMPSEITDFIDTLLDTEGY